MSCFNANIELLVNLLEIGLLIANSWFVVKAQSSRNLLLMAFREVTADVRAVENKPSNQNKTAVCCTTRYRSYEVPARCRAWCFN